MTQPPVTVIMPAYNHERYVAPAIDSVLGQSYGEFEFIIIDDGSTDKTAEVIRSYTDPRIIYKYQKNGGSHAALNRGLELARGEYVAIINSDDVFHCTRLERLLEAFNKDNLEFAITDIELIDGDSKPITDDSHWWRAWYQGLKTAYVESDSPLKALLAGNYTITTSNFFFKATLPFEIGPFRSRRYTLDYDFAFRALKRNTHTFRFLIDEKLLYYRLHGKNTILENPLAANVETFYLLKNSIKDLFGDDIHPSIDHLNKIKRYITKIRDNTWQGEINKQSEIIMEGEKKVSLLESENEWFKERLTAVNDLTAKLLHDRSIIRNSLSYKLGMFLTFPYRYLKGRAGDASKTVKSVKQLHDIIKRLVDDIDVVSFDVFDTILERRIEPPDRVKDIAAARFSKTLKKLRAIELSPMEVLRLRNNIETTLRQEALASGYDYECAFSVLAREMVRRLTGATDEVLFTALVECELSVEKEVLYIKSGMYDLIRWLKAIGKRLIAVSDMYLDQAYVAAIFQDKGLAPYFDAIYVSSMDKVAKHSGRLFMHIFLNETTLPERIVHVGDNKISDFKVPRKLTVKTIHLKDEQSIRNKAVLKAYDTLQRKNPYFRGRHIMQLIKPAPSPGNDFFYDYGFSMLGPVYTTFVYGVIEDINRHRPGKLFFLAREGELFMDLYKVLAPGLLDTDYAPDYEYVYLTRKSTALASAYREFTHDKAIIPFFNPKQEGLYSLFNVYGLPHEEFTAIAAEHGFDNIREPIINWKDERLMALLSDDRFQATVLKHALMHRDLLKDYLEQAGFFNYDRVAFVDIGWNGTIQKFVQDAFEDMTRYPHLHGYYLGYRNGMGHVYDNRKNTIKGVLYDDSYSTPIEQIFMRFEELFEEGARALHPTTVGYRRNQATGTVEPVFKDESSHDRAAELKDNKKIEAIKRGALDFCAEFKKAIALTGYSFDEIKPFVLTMAEKGVAFPESDEVRNLMGLKHAEDFGYENVMDLESGHVGSRLALVRPGSLKRKLASSNWRYGTVKSLQVPGANFLFRLYDIYWRL